MADYFPMKIINVDQYWGTLLKISAKDAFGNDAILRILYCNWFIMQRGKVVGSACCSLKTNQDYLEKISNASVEGICFDDSGFGVELPLSCGLELQLLEDPGAYDEDDPLINCYMSDMFFRYTRKNGLVGEVVKKPNSA